MTNPQPCATCGRVAAADIDREAAMSVRSADHRATALTTTATLAASLATSGAIVVVDAEMGKASALVRGWVECSLIAAMVLFIVSAVIALKGHHRPWTCAKKKVLAVLRYPHGRQREHPDRPLDHLGWPVADAKHAHVTASMFVLVLAMTAVAVFVVASTLVSA